MSTPARPRPWAAQALPWPGEAADARWCQQVAEAPATADEADFRALGLTWSERLALSVPSRRAEHLAVQWCALQAQAALGHAGAPAPGRGPAREPVWAAGLAGSLSHSHGLAFALVARAADWPAVGVDVEPLIEPERARRLAARIAPEGLGPGLSDPRDAALALTAVFGAKECLYKALFPQVGRFFGFAAAQAQWAADAPHHGRVRLRLTETLSDTFRAGTAFEAQWWRHEAAPGPAAPARGGSWLFTRLLWRPPAAG